VDPQYDSRALQHQRDAEGKKEEKQSGTFPGRDVQWTDVNF
jgi:hypothetical protein